MKLAWLNWFSRRSGAPVGMAAGTLSGLPGTAAVAEPARPAEPARRAEPETPAGGVGPRGLPRPALRWVGPLGRIAVREFDFENDVEIVCSFQNETYTTNFPDFHYSESFAAAFRHDLRRASLDPQHGLYVLDDGKVIGFLWLVVCQNTWTGERYGYVNNIYVAPAKRGAGLAGELVRQADTFFRSRRVSRIRLTVTASNQTACHLYERNGYKVTRWEMEKEL